MSNSLGYVLMLDVSGTMKQVLEQVKINAHAFVGWSRIGDQFGINAFSDDAKWVYPTGSTPNILTVSSNYKEVSDSYDRIEGLQIRNMTNIGDAIKLGNNMINQATANLKGFVLLSDGEHNMGVHPNSLLGNTPPLYVAGLGPYLKESYFKEMLKKNPKSKYYHEPNAYQMTLMFDEIVADATESALVMHQFQAMKKGAFYQTEKFNISRDGSEIFIHSVWASKNFKYTSGNIQKNTFKITLMDPDDKTTQYQPDLVKDGYCIYRLKNLKPGEWKMVTEYSIDSENYCTFGGVDFSTTIRTFIDAPIISKVGSSINLTTHVLDGSKIIENAKVTAHIERPTISVENALAKYEAVLETINLSNDISDLMDKNLEKLKILREQKLPQTDILAKAVSSESLNMSKDGTYNLTLDNINEPGFYEVDIKVDETDPQTGHKFSESKKHTIIVA